MHEFYTFPLIYSSFRLLFSYLDLQCQSKPTLDLINYKMNLWYKVWCIYISPHVTVIDFDVLNNSSNMKVTLTTKSIFITQFPSEVLFFFHKIRKCFHWTSYILPIQIQTTQRQHKLDKFQTITWHRNNITLHSLIYPNLTWFVTLKLFSMPQCTRKYFYKL